MNNEKTPKYFKIAGDRYGINVIKMHAELNYLISKDCDNKIYVSISSHENINKFITETAKRYNLILEYVNHFND